MTSKPNLPHCDLSLPYTMEEENWLNRKLTVFRRAFAEIKVTDRNIEEWVRFTRGIPLTKEFNKFGIKTFLERLRRVAISYPEFQVSHTLCSQAPLKSHQSQNLQTG